MKKTDVKCEHPTLIFNKALYVAQFHGANIICNDVVLTIPNDIVTNEELRRFVYKHVNVNTIEDTSYYYVETPFRTYPLFYFVPCGKCLLCHQRKTFFYSFRAACCSATSATHPLFVTLTFNDLFLPDDAGLHKKLLQDFIKRLRMRLKRMHLATDFKYFACGEYGENNTYRPHFHLNLYNLPPCRKSKQAKHNYLAFNKTHLEFYKNVIGACWTARVTSSYFDKYRHIRHSYVYRDKRGVRVCRLSMGRIDVQLASSKGTQYLMKYQLKQIAPHEKDLTSIIPLQFDSRDRNDILNFLRVPIDEDPQYFADFINTDKFKQSFARKYCRHAHKRNIVERPFILVSQGFGAQLFDVCPVTSLREHPENNTLRVFDKWSNKEYECCISPYFKSKIFPSLSQSMGYEKYKRAVNYVAAVHLNMFEMNTPYEYIFLSKHIEDLFQEYHCMPFRLHSYTKYTFLDYLHKHDIYVPSDTYIKENYQSVKTIVKGFSYYRNKETEIARQLHQLYMYDVERDTQDNDIDSIISSAHQKYRQYIVSKNNNQDI